MKEQIRKCPQCGSFVRGAVKLSTTESMAQGVGEGALKFTVDLLTGGIGGTLLKSSGALREIGNASREAMTTHTNIEFDCPCGHKWEELIGNKEEIIPDEILQCQKDEAISRFQNKASSNLTWAIVFGLIFCLFLWYLISNPAYIEIPTHNWWNGEDFMRKDIQWGWVGMCFLAIIFFVPTISKFHSYKERKNDVKRLQRMSLKNFKNSEYRK